MITYLNQSQTARNPEASVVTQSPVASESTVRMPLGLIGLSNLTQFVILYDAQELPFMHLKATEGGDTEFIVIEPRGLIPDYSVEILDGDVEYLQIQSAEDVMILNIVTIHQSARKSKVTVNLVGPIIVNRHTRMAKQVVIGNYQKYSANHLLFEDSQLQ